MRTCRRSQPHCPLRVQRSEEQVARLSKRVFVRSAPQKLMQVNILRGVPSAVDWFWSPVPVALWPVQVTM